MPPRRRGQRLGYIPDRAARRLRTGRTQVISLLLNTQHEFLGFTHEFLSGITEVVVGTGYSVTVVPTRRATTGGAGVRPLTILAQLTSPTGCSSPGPSLRPRVRLLMGGGFPLRQPRQTEFTAPHPWVDFDNEAFARAPSRIWWPRGARGSAWCCPATSSSFTQHLRYGFLSRPAPPASEHEIVAGVTLDSPTPEIARP